MSVPGNDVVTGLIDGFFEGISCELEKYSVVGRQSLGQLVSSIRDQCLRTDFDTHRPCYRYGDEICMCQLRYLLSNVSIL